MEKRDKINLYTTLGVFAAFVVYTIMIMFIDVRAIGPEGSKVGFAAINGLVHNTFGYNGTLDFVTDIIMYLAFLSILAWAVVGLVQLIKRKSLKKVDYRLYVLAIFAVITVAVYILFDHVLIINYRPIILDEGLEGSYPSTHCLLTLAFFGYSIVNLFVMKINKNLAKILSVVIGILCLLMPVLRLLAGVHWTTDIVGGVMLSIALVLAYNTLVNWKKK